MAELRERSDLEKRTFAFAQDVRRFVGIMPKTILNTPDRVQLIRSSGSVGANYLEAQEAMSRKDFSMRIKICRKEAKESLYWLRLLDGTSNTFFNDKKRLMGEAQELVRIFNAIAIKSSST